MKTKKIELDGATRLAVVVLNFLNSGKYSFSAKEISDSDPTLVKDLGDESFMRYVRHPLFDTRDTTKINDQKFWFMFGPDNQDKRKNKNKTKPRAFRKRTNIIPFLLDLGPRFLGEWFKTCTRWVNEGELIENHRLKVRKDLNNLLCSGKTYNEIKTELMGMVVKENKRRLRKK